jgi:hypothetical protein
MNHSLTRRRAPMLLGMSAMLVLGACGGGGHSTAAGVTSTSAAPVTTAAAAPTTAPAPPPPPDPCHLVSQSQAEALAQTPLQAAVEAGAPPDVMCQYDGPTTGPTAQVEIFVGDGAKKTLDIDRDELHHDFTTLTGIGDEAYLEDNDVFLRKGDIWVEVNVVLLDVPPDQIQSGLQTMAKQIASAF